jgi:hypothetical protein
VNVTGGSPLLRRLARDGYVLLAAAFLLLRLFQVPPWDQSVDAYAYWSTRDGMLYDGQTAGAMGAYVYSPAFAQLLMPLTWLPWPVFVTIWTAANLAIVWWLLGRWSLPAMLFLPIPFEIVSGNVHLMYAAAVVLGFRASATWLLPFITKVTPGIGVLWFAVRREWRAFVVALAVTGAIVGVSYALDPAAWRAWFDVLTGSSSTPETVGWFLPVPLLIRLPIALVVVVLAAALDRRWVLPVGIVLAMPVLWLNSFAVLAACVPLWLASEAGRSALPRAIPASAEAVES